MSGGESVGAGLCTARRIARYLIAKHFFVAVTLTAAAVFLVSAATPADTSSSPLIRIPPARLPPPQPATASGVPVEARVPLPAKMQLVRDPDDTGVALHGVLEEEAASAIGVIVALLGKSEIFELAPATQLGLADPTDRRAEALFSGMVHGASVIGVACATRGDVTLLYDDVGAFAASFPHLRRAFAADDPEIGISDNSAAQGDMAMEIEPSPRWAIAIAAATKGGEAPLDRALAESLALDLGNGAEPWRIIPSAQFTSERK